MPVVSCKPTQYGSAGLLVQGLDVMPVVSASAAENRPSLGQPTRLRLTGRTKLSGRLTPQPAKSGSASQLPASAFEGQPLNLAWSKGCVVPL